MLHSRYVIVVLIIVCLLLARAVWGVYGKYERSKDLADTAARDFAVLQTREKHLASLTESLKTEEGQGREIRDRFGLVQEGERAVIIIDDEREDAPHASTTESGFWQWLLDLFR